MKLIKIQLRPLFMATFLSFALVAGCGKDSSTESGTDDADGESILSTKDCGKGASCEGTYSNLSSDSKVWTGVCEVREIDSGEWAYIRFHEMTNCRFDWIRAQGSVGSDWISLASGTATEFMVEHTGEDVFQLRRCENGGNTDNDGCL